MIFKKRHFKLKHFKMNQCSSPGEIETKCTNHKEKDPSDKCKNAQCTERASFGKPEEKAEFCDKHKQKGMVNLNHYGTCLITNCTGRGYYCFVDQKNNGRYCSTHKVDGMINPEDKKCQTQGCAARPIFGFIGGKAIVCSNHKEPIMVDLVSGGYCKYEGCKKRGSYVCLDDDNKYCEPHSRGKRRKTIDTRICIHDGCTKRKVYGFPGKSLEYCPSHKHIGMIDLVHPHCVVDGCEKRATVKPENEKKKMYCNVHNPKANN